MRPCSMALRNTEPSPVRCVCPAKADKLLGLNLSARGVLFTEPKYKILCSVLVVFRVVSEQFNQLEVEDDLYNQDHTKNQHTPRNRIHDIQKIINI